MTDIDDGPLDPDFYKRHEWEMPHPTRYIGDDGGSNLDAQNAAPADLLDTTANEN